MVGACYALHTAAVMPYLRSVCGGSTIGLGCAQIAAVQLAQGGSAGVRAVQQAVRGRRAVCLTEGNIAHQPMRGVCEARSAHHLPARRARQNACIDTMHVDVTSCQQSDWYAQSASQASNGFRDRLRRYEGGAVWISASL